MASAVRSRRGGFKLFDQEQFHYRVDYRRKGKTYWKCVEARCVARKTTGLIESEGQVDIISVTGSHDHSARPLDSLVLRAKNSMKSNTLMTEGSSRKVVSSALTEVNDNVKGNLPTNESLSRCTRRLV